MRLAEMSLQDVERMHERVSNTVIAQEIVNGRVLCIRDVANGEQAFHYSSGNFGPGYITVKGACSNQRLFKFLVRQLALKIYDAKVQCDFIAGLVTGGYHHLSIYENIYRNCWVENSHGYIFEKHAKPVAHRNM